MPKKTAKTKTKVEKPKQVVVNVEKNDLNGQLPYLLMDAADDSQVLAEIEGRISEIAGDLVYFFRDKTGHEVTGLSWVGTKAAAYHFRRQKMVNLSVEDVTWEKDKESPEHYIFKAKVKDLISGANSIGLKRQCVKLHKKDGKVIDNEFWVEQGRSKSIRNGMQDLMPTDWMAKQIKKWVKSGNVRVLKEDKAQISLGTESLTKIKVFVNSISEAKTKESLDIIERNIIESKNLDGKEKYFVRQSLEARRKQI